jgi:hypothetical protein
VRGGHGHEHNISRGFHRLGLLLAVILAIALTLGMMVDFVHLRLWDVQAHELPMVVGGLFLGLIGWGLVGVALYSLVRAIGWVIGRFVA